MLTDINFMKRARSPVSGVRHCSLESIPSSLECRIRVQGFAGLSAEGGLWDHVPLEFH